MNFREAVIKLIAGLILSTAGYHLQKEYNIGDSYWTGCIIGYISFAIIYYWNPTLDSTEQFRDDILDDNLN